MRIKTCSNGRTGQPTRYNLKGGVSNGNATGQYHLTKFCPVCINLAESQNMGGSGRDRKSHGIEASGLDGVEDTELVQTSISIGWRRIVMRTRL